MLKTSSIILFNSRRWAGHSKWANIKHIKAQKDGEKSRIYTKLCQKIKLAIQEGGSANPDHNYLLAQAIDVAKKQSMPVSSIQNCIKSAQADKSKFTTALYEVRGVGGSMFIVSALTDNLKKTKESLSPILRKNFGAFADHSGKHLFDRKGIIVASLPSRSKIDFDEVVNYAIECEAEEVSHSIQGEGVYEFTCEMESMERVKGNLSKLNFSIVSVSFQFIPKVRVSLSPDEEGCMKKLLDKIEDHPDVVSVYDNIA